MNSTWTTDGYFVTVTFKRPGSNANGTKDGTITSQKIAQKGSVSQQTIMYDLADLQAKGIIAREGGRKNGRWVILKTIE